MVGLPYDCLSNPLGAVRLTFEKAVVSGSNPAVLDGKEWGATELFRQFLFDDDGLFKVPLLGPSTIKWVQPNTLVRFRGMIQDMLGNEYYVGAYKDGDMWRTNKFADASRCPMDPSSDMRIWERRLLYCVPVPGQNSWVETPQEAMRNSFVDSASPQREKRQREDQATLIDVDMTELRHDAIEDSPNAKKMREDGLALGSSNSQKTVTEGNSSSSCLGTDIESTPFPCLVKIYDFPDSELKLNDVFEFVGIFTFDPDLALARDDPELINDFCEDALVNLPPSKVPRLHCVAHRKLMISDFLPGPQFELTPCAVKEVREAVIGHLTAILGNDRVAAQYMLLHLLSRVHARVESIAIGKLSLNLTCFNKESNSVFGNNLKLAIENLLPFTRCLPLTVDYLNNISLAPRKDYETNRLVSSILQLAEGSHMIIDETPLQTGTLNSTGCENARVLKTMMEAQKVEYDFTYYKMEMASDIQLLILSEGKSNILPADLVLPFCPSSVMNSTLGVSEEMLKAWRWYLATMKSLPHTIDQQMQKVLEDDLVSARQSDRSLGTQDFSRWLTMGRLMSVSFGERCLSKEHWEMVKELEGLRKERLQGNM